MGDGQRQAGQRPPAVEQHGAGTALAVVAALLRAGDAEPLAERVQQRRAGVDRQPVRSRPSTRRVISASTSGTYPSNVPGTPSPKPFRAATGSQWPSPRHQSVLQGSATAVLAQENVGRDPRSGKRDDAAPPHEGKEEDQRHENQCRAAHPDQPREGMGRTPSVIATSRRASDAASSCSMPSRTLRSFGVRNCDPSGLRRVGTHRPQLLAIIIDPNASLAMSDFTPGRRHGTASACACLAAVRRCPLVSSGGRVQVCLWWAV